MVSAFGFIPRFLQGLNQIVAGALVVKLLGQLGVYLEAGSHDTLFVSWAFSSAVRFRQPKIINLN
jgi:hypothetical protein